MQADENGGVYITSFSAKDYGIFSQRSEVAPLAPLSIALENIGGSSKDVLNAYWAVDNEGNICWRSLVVTQKGEKFELCVVDSY